MNIAIGIGVVIVLIVLGGCFMFCAKVGRDFDDDFDSWTDKDRVE